jgi:hypothetical protein
MFAYGVGLIFETAVGSTSWQQARPILLRMGALLMICLALVPLNPSGAQLYRYPFDTLRSHGMRSVISEWFSPDFHEWLYRPFLLVWLLILAALARSRSRPRGRVIVPLLLTCFAALDAVRHIPIFVLVAMPVIAGALPAASEGSELLQRRPGLRFRPVFIGSVVLLMAVLTLVKWVRLGQNQDAREAEQFPQKALAFLRTAGGPRNVFVYYDWGGYAIWKLYPENRVFVDGRADLYVADRVGDQNNDLLQQFETAVRLRNGWREVLDRWKVEAVLVPPTCALAQGLLIDSSWHTVFSDPKAILLVRTYATAENAEVFRTPSRIGQ